LAKEQKQSSKDEMMPIKNITSVFRKELKIEDAIRSMIFDFSKT
jgi:hypothetical protein